VAWGIASRRSRLDARLFGRGAAPRRPVTERGPVQSSAIPGEATSEARSLFGEILDWMLAPLLVLWPMSIFLTYLVAQNIANRPYDRQMSEIVRAVARQVEVRPLERSEGMRSPFQLPEVAMQLLRADDVDAIYFQVLGVRGEFIAGDRGLPLPTPGEVATNEVHFREEAVAGETVRVAYMWLPALGDDNRQAALVQLAETLGKRKLLATEIIKGVILPQFIILPAAVVLVWFALSRGIRPLNQLQARIRQREASDLSPIDQRDVPDEVSPLVRAINDLLARLDQTIVQQKHFIADAAHQLKTPLAGLRMQAELAVRQIDSGESDTQGLKRSLEHIALSSQRGAHMVNQLLSMARAEDREQALRKTRFDLGKLVVEVVQDFVPKAMDKRIDLGFEGPQEGVATELMGLPVLMREMVRNLVDNALQYTPAGGTVTARVTSDPFGQVVVVQVEDNGPGIPPAEREMVFRAFYRVLGSPVDGSGLGLAIVQEVAGHHDAEVTLGDAFDKATANAHGHGLGALFTVRIPLKLPATGVASPE
jgi:two-component system, OmpR family, sensor histidine kinase TctE